MIVALATSVKKMDFGYYLSNNRTIETTPSLFSFASLKERRKIFLTLYNSCVDKDLKINSHFADTGLDLHDIFLRKIANLMTNFSGVQCNISKIILKNYENKNYKDLHAIYPKLPINPAAKLIQMIYKNEQVGLNFDGSMLFANYIYDKILTLHKDKNVTFEDGLIIVKKDEEEILGVMPSFKYVRMNKPQDADKEINRAFNILQKRDIKKLFIAFPKNEEFTRHLVVKQYSEDEDSKLTLVPYAITHKNSCGFSQHSK